MQFHSSDIVAKARVKRQEGLSLRAIAREFGVSSSTISRWVKDIDYNDKSFNNARNLENSYKMKDEALVDNFEVDKTKAKVLASILYWCEGYKYPASNHVGFCNSDYNMSKTFITLLRSGYTLDESKFRVHLQIHTTHNLQSLIKFWSELLDIPASQFYKPTVTKPTGTMKRLDYKGTCTIKYYDVKILWQLMGLYQSLYNKFLER